MDHRQSVEEIPPEPTGVDFKFQIAIRRANETRIDRERGGFPDGRKSLLLNDAEEFGLQGGGQFADFVKERGTAIGLAEEANLVLDGAGEGSLQHVQRGRIQKASQGLRCSQQ